MDWITSARNKVLATVIRTLASRTYTTHQDEILQVESRDTSRTIKTHVYHAKTHDTTKPSPVLINFHASGFVIPMHGSDDEFCVRVSKETPYCVLDVQYRLAPEHPFPAALNDAEDVVRYVLAHPETYDTSHISLSGFSAGANLVLAICDVFPSTTFRHLLAFYPPVDIAKPPAAKTAPEPARRPLPNFVATMFNDSYAPAGTDRAQPRISPLHGDAARFPDNVLIITCGGDNLAEEGEELARSIAKAGKHVLQRRMEGCDHAWDKEAEKGSVQEEKKDEAYGLAVEMLGR